MSLDEQEFREQSLQSGLLKSKKLKTSIFSGVKIEAGVLSVKPDTLTKRSAYLASMISSYLAKKLFESHQSFCLETVMSHPGKIDLFDAAVRHGYQSYLYFVFTDDVRKNIERVKKRVEQGGHAVAAAKIRSRYHRSLKNLQAAIEGADKSFLIDNSGDEYKTMLTVDRSKKRIEMSVAYPSWMLTYFDPTNRSG